MKLKQCRGRIYNVFKNRVEQEPDFMKYFSYDGEYDQRNSIKILNYIHIDVEMNWTLKVYVENLIMQIGPNRWDQWSHETSITCFVHRVI